MLFINGSGSDIVGNRIYNKIEEIGKNYLQIKISYDEDKIEIKDEEEIENPGGGHIRKAQHPSQSIGRSILTDESEEKCQNQQRDQ